jgi:CRISPR-associated endonuclease/helicase Cas3
MNGFPTFGEFFQALWGMGPFPWQEMLAERVAAEQWPDAIDLPTASGKTACLDIAVYALAAQADKPLGKRTTARRIWFVVDRRIVVDEAFERAQRLAQKLADPNGPEPIRAVAGRLLAVGGLLSRERPLAVGRLRGGVLRDDRWARVPSQPALITSTVDQLGSRLLFRGYGHSALAAPIYAALAANDSLILLDEAHCAVPFLQTLRAVKKFRGTAWSELPNPTGFHVVVLSATPPDETDGEPLEVFPAAEARERALNHPVLQARLTASKPAVLEKVESEVVLERRLAERAAEFARNGKRRIGVIVNRIGRAMQVAEALRAKARENIPEGQPPAFEVEVLTGRIRPVERDALVGKRLAPVLHSSVQTAPERPLILVATQCLEVGADFSFDALVTECASLDALRQRFGRLARLGNPENAEAIILAAEDALKAPDPIYGEALKKTWEFLQEKATVETRKEARKTLERRTIDFGFESLRSLLPPHDEILPLLAPTADAPILLPAHLDLLCQTSPIPHPDPDVSLFLHGKGRGAAEVRVVWRGDLDPHRTDQWIEIVSLCRPVAGEMLSVPLWRLRQWLRDRTSPDKSGDVEGNPADIREQTSPSETARQAFLIWRGRDRSEVTRDPDRIGPDDIVVLPSPATRGEAETLGQVLGWQGFGPQNLDLWEIAWNQTGRPPMLRLHRTCLGHWAAACPPLADALTLAETGDWTADELRNALAAVRNWQPEEPDGKPLPDWLHALFAAVADFRVRDLAAEHPGGGLILRARPRQQAADETDFFADEDDIPTEAPDRVTLEAHSLQVADIADTLARACLGQGAEAHLLAHAGQWHDAGKLDPRFQALLRGGTVDVDGSPLAKSPDLPRSPEQARAVAQAAGLPEGFRHEMLAAQLAKLWAAADLTAADRDLVLHLIASHHGHARPFAPVCLDEHPPEVRGQLAGVAIALDAGQRRQLVPAHRLDSGLADRFWRLTRRFGWWGLAYREAILRLADWYASAHPHNPQNNNSPI